MILNQSQLAISKIRKDLLHIIESVLTAIDPFNLVKQNFSLKDNNVLTAAKRIRLNLNHFEHIYVVGAGKAAYKMALAVEQTLKSRITAGSINIPALPAKNELKRIKIAQASHPTPNQRGVNGAKRIRQILAKTTGKDLVIAVISGGGSSLLPLPADGISLKEKIKLTSLLLKTPATIHEINVIRKHLSQIKGGQLACMAYPATVVGLYISDIVDNSFEIQASGPTAPDTSTFADAVRILKKYDIWNKTPKNIRARFFKGVKGLLPETPKKTHKVFTSGKVHNFTIGNHNTAVKAAAEMGKKSGYHCLELTSSLQGEAREVSKMIVAVGKHVARYNKPIKKPALIVAGGETTVHVRGTGKGGRNQELVLAAIPQLQKGMTIVSFGTDGVDGITPEYVAGAIADTDTAKLASRKKLDIQKFLSNNDSYNFFKTIGGHIKTGPSGTNVGDLILLAVN